MSESSQFTGTSQRVVHDKPFVGKMARGAGWEREQEGVERRILRDDMSTNIHGWRYLVLMWVTLYPITLAAKIPRIVLHVREQPHLELVSRIVAKFDFLSEPLNVFNARHELSGFGYRLQVLALVFGEIVTINRDLHSVCDLRWKHLAVLGWWLVVECLG
jgi:hypothetical protein